MDDEYGECCKIHKHLDGKSDGCQKYVDPWSKGICGNCGCNRYFHREVKPPIVRYKTEVVYTKCHKIHDFKFQCSVDGCQEFTPGGKVGTTEALTCAICGCHRGFHRNEITKEVTSTS